MDFNFTSEVPSTRGRTYIDVEHAEEVLDACLGNPGEWAQVPYTYLHPDAEGVDPKKLAVRCRNVAGRIQHGELAPFNEYNTEAKARGLDVYIRIAMTSRELRALEEI